MIHGRRVSHRDCVTCQWVATRQGRTTSGEEDILYLCICLYFELKTQTRDNRHPSLTHIRPLCWSWRRHARVKRARQHIHPQPETIRGTHESALLIIFACFLSGGWHIPAAHVYFYRLHLKSYSQATWIWFNGVSKTQQTNNVVLSYLCTVNEFCVSAEKTTQNQNTQKNDKKTPILLTGCFVRRFSVSMFSVFILTVQFNLGWKVKQKNKK